MSARIDVHEPGVSEVLSFSKLLSNGIVAVDSGSSARWDALTQPFWTNISLPSGRTSVTVTSNSASAIDERTTMSTEPDPM